MFSANRSLTLHPKTPSTHRTRRDRVRAEGLQTQLRWPDQQGCTGNSWECQEVLVVAAPLVLLELQEEEPLTMQCVL